MPLSDESTYNPLLCQMRAPTTHSPQPTPLSDESTYNPLPTVHVLARTGEVPQGQVVCETAFASLAVVYCQKLEICVVLESAILSTHVGICAELDRATRALDEEKTLPGIPAGGTFGPQVNSVDHHNTKREEYKVSVPQYALAQHPERNERPDASVT